MLARRLIEVRGDAPVPQVQTAPQNNTYWLLAKTPALIFATDVLTDLAQPVGVDRFRYCKRPHKSARANTCNDAASGNKMRSSVCQSLSTRY
jgi:hypothetical protein